MQITFLKHEANVSVTVMQLSGKLDASNYTEVIDSAQQAYTDGARNILIDLSKVPYISSAGLMSLHTVVLIFSGQSAISKDGRRPTFRPINMARDGEVRKHVKLFNPQPEVLQVLDVIGLKQFFEVHVNLDTAVKSF
jgi:anti-anti-sigma regulatory factor